MKTKSEALHQVVEDELFRLRPMMLDRMPSAEDMPFCIQVMVEDLEAMGLGEADVHRVRAAIRRHGREFTHWPRSKEVMASLPKHMKTVKEALPYLEKPRTEAERAESKARGQAVLAELKRRLDEGKGV